MATITVKSDQIWLKNTGAQGQTWSPVISGLPTGAIISAATLSFTLHNSYATPGAVYVYKGSSNASANRLWYVSASAYRDGVSYSVDLSSYVTGNGTFPLYFYKSGNTSQNYLCFTSIVITVTYTQPSSTFTLSSSSINAGETMTVSITRSNTSYTHKVIFAIGTRSNTISNVATQTSYTVPLSWVDQMPSSTSGKASVTVETYSGATKVGTGTKYFTLTCPTSVAPTVGDITTEIIDGKWGLCVQGYSKVKIAAPNCAAGTGATLNTVSISGGGYSTSTSKLTTGYLKTAGDVTFTIAVTDSRGRKTTKTVTMAVTAYNPITIAGITCYRSDEGKIAQPINGTCVTLGCSYVMSAIGENAANVRVMWKTGDSGWIELVDFPDVSGETYVKMAGELDTAAKYDFRIMVEDGLSSAEQETVVPSSQVFMRWDKTNSAVGFGCFPQGSKRIEVDDWDLYVGGRNIVDELENVDAELGNVSAVVATLSSQMKKQHAANLLDNSDFSNVVNQRGSTSYSGSGYTIDRWRFTTTGGTLTVGDGCITNAGATLVQILESYDSSAVYTLAACDVDGNIRVVSGKFDDTPTTSYVNLWVSSGYARAEIKAGSWVWAALYKGEYDADSLPGYMPKGYAAEYLECSRYYFAPGCSSAISYTGYTNATNAARFTIPTPVKMRVKPSISVETVGNVTVFFADASCAATAITMGEQSGNSVSIAATLASTTTAWQVCSLRFNTVVSLSADL